MTSSEKGRGLKCGFSELKYMSWIVRKELFMELAPIETIDKELQDCLQGFRFGAGPVMEKTGLPNFLRHGANE